VRNTIFRGARLNGQVGGFALRVGQATDVRVHNNTFYDNDIVLISGDMSGEFKNNIVFGGEIRRNSGTIWEADHNAWSRLASNVPWILLGGHDLWIGDPMLGPNLYPLPESPVIDAGQDLGLIDDYCGRLRIDGSTDMGAFEFFGDSEALGLCESRFNTDAPLEPFETR
jgi:hypothetical protein